MEPYEYSELGEIGEGLWAIERTQPLTQLRLASRLASLRNPLPLEREITPTAAQYPSQAIPATPSAHNGQQPYRPYRPKTW
jgi:hypothetical protein